MVMGIVRRAFLKSIAWHEKRQWIDGIGHDPYAPSMQAAMLGLLESFAKHWHSSSPLKNDTNAFIWANKA
jgi:hypothetical protein